MITANKREERINMKNVFEFLKACGTFFLATEEGDQPRVRPFGAVCQYDGKLYFCTNNTKQVWRQMKQNPKVEISASLNGEWIRLTGKAVFDGRKEAKAAMLEENPRLKNMYGVDDGLFEVFYLESAAANILSFAGRNDTYLF